jgi:hypothetical protein
MAKKTKSGQGESRGARFPAGSQEEQKQRQRDLNPAQDIGRSSAGDPQARTAAEIKTLVERLSEFTNDQLAQIPIVADGTQLKQGAVYLDLRDPAPVPITATAEMVAGPSHYYTLKAEVPYEIWNRLVESLGPARLRPDAPTDAAENKPFTPQRAAAEAAVGHPPSSSETIADSKMDETLAESFPASDPPSWNTGRETKTDSNDTEGDDLKSLSDEELKRRAGELNIRGRENMTREQLLRAIRGQLASTEA